MEIQVEGPVEFSRIKLVFGGDATVHFRKLPLHGVVSQSQMSRILVIAFSLVSAFSALAQNADDSLRSQLEGIHAKWFAAFRSADVATMNQIETRNIVLVMPNGFVLKDFSPRKKGDAPADPATKDTLSRVTARQFGDTAILVGILTSESPKETSRAAETAVFVRDSGQWKIATVQWTSLASKN